MSLFVPGDRDPAAWPFGHVGPEHECYLCAEPLENLPAVGWRGSTDIFLHADCVPSLCQRLLMDWEQAQQAKAMMGLFKGE